MRKFVIAAVAAASLLAAASAANADWILTPVGPVYLPPYCYYDMFNVLRCY
jgi:hypothetical protein